MIRKLLLFVVLFAGGVYLLTYMTDGPVWRKSTKEDDRGEIQTPPPGVNLESKKQGQTNKPNVKVSGTGALTIKGSPIRYEIGGGSQLDLPSYVLRAKNHRIRNNGIYDLDEVQIDFLRPMRKGGQVVKGTPVTITASSMRVTIETEGEVQRLDQSQEMDFYDVVVRSRLERRQKNDILAEHANETLTLESAHLSGFLGDEVLDLHTEEREKVTLTMQSKQGNLRLSGLGVLGTIQTGTLSRKNYSEIRLLHDIKIDGTGEFTVSVTGKGPLMAKGGRDLPWFVQLDNEVRISVKQTSRGPGSLINGEGERVRLWMGSTDLLVAGESRPRRGLSDLSLQGRPARILLNAQSVESRQIHVAFNHRGDLTRLATEGLTRFWLRDEKGRSIGKFRGRDGMLWTREGRQAASVLAGMGIDFLGSALGLVDPLWPEEVIQVLGPAAYESEGGVRGLGEDVEKATAEEGLLIYAAWRFGRLHPFMIQGLGDVRIRGRLQDDGALMARGNRGFTLLSEMGSGVVNGGMGQVGGEDKHRFEVRMERQASDADGEAGRIVDVVEGQGWIRFSGKAVLDAKSRKRTALEIGFHAGLQQELAWRRTVAEEETRIDGIKSSRYEQDGQGWYGLHLEGIPLRVSASEENIRATAEFCDKKSKEPWSLRGQMKPVHFYMGGSDRESQAHLQAKEVRFRRIPVTGPDEVQPILLPLQAIGKVRLEVDFPEEAGKKRRLELDCMEFRYLPIVAAPALESIVSGMLGPGGGLLASRLLGNQGGLARALGSVTLELVELGGKKGKEKRMMSGEDLVFEADSFSSRILPKPGGLVEVRIEEGSKQRLWARAEVARTLGADMDLGVEGGGRVEVWSQDREKPDQVFHLASEAPVIYRSELAKWRISAKDCGEPPGEDRYKGRYGIVEFPGPVKGKQLGVSSEMRFEVSCSERLIMQLRTEERRVDSSKGRSAGTWVLPQGFDRLLALGHVRFLYHDIEARGDALGLAGESGWFRLSSRGKRPVLLGFGDEYHAKAHPGIAYNLRTGEENTGRFLIKSTPLPKEEADR